MHKLSSIFRGPWRAVPVLGVTQILAWAVIFYPPVLTVPLISAERGWSATFTMSGLSVGLLVAGLVSPIVGILIDRHGGHRVMPIGSLAGALGLVGLVFARDPVSYLAVWMLLGVAMAGSLYDPAFATLGRIFAGAARRPITIVTFAGGFASTVSWPTTYVLLENLGWQRTYLVYAALLALVAAPLHAFALPRERVAAALPATDGGGPAPAAVLPPNGIAFVLVAAAFATYAFVPSGLAAHMIAIFERSGLDPATVVIIGALFGPAQVAARLCEFVFGRNIHPLWVARFSVGLLVLAFVMLALLGLSVATAAAFALIFGAANGLITIARGTVPLVLFGANGYGRLLGRIAGPFLLIQAAAPLVMALVAERSSDAVALGVAAAFATVALMCLTLIRRPGA